MKCKSGALASVLAGALALAFGCAHNPAAETALHSPPHKRPNILIITTDQQTWNAMSACGNPYLRTPAMDRLAAGGIRFEKSYCAAPVCSPSRSALLSGRMPHETGVDFNQQTPKPDVPNVGEIFRQSGYETAYAGKWHLPSLYPGCRGETIPGFDVLPLNPQLKPPFEERDLDHADQRDADVATATEAYLRRPHDRPFLLVVSLLNPHDICYHINGMRHYFVPPDLTATPPLPANFGVDPDEPEFMHIRRNQLTYGAEIVFTRNWTEADWRKYLYVYYRLVERVDAELQRILHALTDAGLDKETLIVFTSDHGEGLAAHHWVVKLSLYETTAKVPLLLRWPGVIPGGAIDQDHVVSGIDVVPTLCDYAGVPSPAKSTGRSLRSIIEQPASPGREFVVSELATDKERPEVMGRMLRTARYKYIAYSIGRNNEQLFDLTTDPGEMHNLASTAAMGAELKRHRELLRQWVQQTDDHFPVPPSLR